uniref:Uncharacterized protein n=1 Tax=Rhizophora mucronata TaxID=61149 RepID=A0A2P2R0X4_RHIMU
MGEAEAKAYMLRRRESQRGKEGRAAPKTSSYHIDPEQRLRNGFAQRNSRSDCYLPTVGCDCDHDHRRRHDG